MPLETNKGISMLGSVISEQAKRVNEKPASLDFGVIQDDYSLKTNNFKQPIPKGDYLLCRQLTLGPTGNVLTQSANDGLHNHGSSGAHGGHTGGSGTHTHTKEGPHVHDILIPEKMRSLLPGDRVLVAWVMNEAVIVDIVVRS